MKKPKLIIDTDDLAYEGFQSRVSVVRHPINDPYSPLEDEEILEAYSDMIDIGIRILHKLQSETESVTAIEQWDLEQALRKAGCTDD